MAVKISYRTHNGLTTTSRVSTDVTDVAKLMDDVIITRFCTKSITESNVEANRYFHWQCCHPVKCCYQGT